MSSFTSSSWLPLLLGAVTVGLAAFLAWPAIEHLVAEWIAMPAYGHGPVLVIIAAALFWQRRDRFAQADGRGHLWGVPVLAGALLLLVVASHGAIHVFAQYALVAVVAAIGMALFGWRFPLQALLPLMLLFMAIPLPGAIETSLTADLKLLSTSLAGDLLRLLHVPVYIEGNMVDLGVYHLQVADACAGLNYLFPLLSLAVLLSAHLYTPTWKRVVIVVFAVPITVAMNTLRIAVTGLLVRHFGPSAADGFVHAFEGWLLFLAALLMLLPVASLVLRLGPTGTTLRRALLASSPSSSPGEAGTTFWRRAPAVLCAVLALAALTGAGMLAERPSHEPQRESLADFPMRIDDWQGQYVPAPLEAIRALELSEFLMAEYRGADGMPGVELYIAYYDSQADGRTPHSPADCLPGGGWEILTFDRTDLTLRDGTAVPVNRAVMQIRHERMLVYYFYRQGPRWLNSEYLAKWYLFQDSVVAGRNDGALVRLTVPIATTPEAAERELLSFMNALWQPLQLYFGA